MLELYDQVEENAPYVMLHAPEPYVWEMETCISHYEAIGLGITCMVPYPSMKPCKKFRECVSCQGFKGTQWHLSQAAGYHRALNFFMGVLPPCWSSMNSEGNELEGIAFLDRVLANQSGKSGQMFR